MQEAHAYTQNKEENLNDEEHELIQSKSDFEKHQQTIYSSSRIVSQFCVSQSGNLSSHKNASENEHPEVFKDRAHQMHGHFANEFNGVMKACDQIEASHQEIKKLYPYLANPKEEDLVKSTNCFEMLWNRFFSQNEERQPNKEDLPDLFSIGSDFSEIRSILEQIKQEESKIFESTSSKVDNGQR